MNPNMGWHVCRRFPAMSGLSDLKEAEQELEKVEEMLAMAERAI
jgi:hypothetical protein